MQKFESPPPYNNGNITLVSKLLVGRISIFGTSTWCHSLAHATPNADPETPPIPNS